MADRIKHQNKAHLIGVLGRDPEIRALRNGNRLASLSVATEERWKDKKTGEWTGKTEWHRVSTFADQHIDTAEGLSKGDAVEIEGQIQTRKWEKDGHTNYSTEIVISGWGILKRAGAAPKGEPMHAGNAREQIETFDDEIPF